MKNNFEKNLTEEEKNEIAKCLARGEEDLKNGKWFDNSEFKKRIRRLKLELAEREKQNLQHKVY